MNKEKDNFDSLFKRVEQWNDLDRIIKSMDNLTEKEKSDLFNEFKNRTINKVEQLFEKVLQVLENHLQLENNLNELNHKFETYFNQTLVSLVPTVNLKDVEQQLLTDLSSTYLTNKNKIINEIEQNKSLLKDDEIALYLFDILEQRNFEANRKFHQLDGSESLYLLIKPENIFKAFHGNDWLEIGSIVDYQTKISLVGLKQILNDEKLNDKDKLAKIKEQKIFKSQYDK